MLSQRIIPTLLVRARGLIKTIKFENGTYLGDPVNAIKIFNEKEVDELVILDIDATIKRDEPDWYMLNRLNREAFMPLAYGGGVRSVEHVEKVINLGYEKVIINAAFRHNPGFVKEASKVAGNQSIVVCIDVTKNKDGSYSVFDYLEKKPLEIDPVELSKRAEDAGAGEVLIQSYDREGTWSGFDLVLLKNVSSAIGIPVIGLGGASSYNDLQEVLSLGISAAAGSLFVFFGRLKAVLINYPDNSAVWRRS